MQIIVKNISSESILLSDIGYQLNISETIDLLDFFPFDVICSSEVLKQQVIAENIVVNDGTNDLLVADALKHLSTQTQLEDEREEQMLTTIKQSEEFSIAMSIALGGL